MFADLCFFTQLARELGAEKVGEVVDSFLSRADGNDRWIYNFELENTVRGVGGYGLDVRGSVFEGMVSNSSMIGNRLGGAYFGHS